VIERLFATLLLLAVLVVVVIFGLPLMVVAMWWIEERWETQCESSWWQRFWLWCSHRLDRRRRS
jgi:hypothetical protein